MDPTARGHKLWDDAYKLLEARKSGMDAAEFHKAAKAKALEIMDFLSAEGPELDQTKQGYDIVTQLGKAYDALAKGASDTIESILPSPTATFFKTLPKEIAKEADAWKLNLKRYVPWLIGGAAVLLLAVVGVNGWASSKGRK
jgi:hypothetical protein